LSSHVCKTDAPLQRALPGRHSPAQPVAAQTYVHGAPSLHAPFGPQVKKTLPSHFVEPGWQTPTQAPALQRNGQVTSSFHPFVGPQVMRSRSMHVLVPAVHPASPTD